MHRNARTAADASTSSIRGHAWALGSRGRCDRVRLLLRPQPAPRRMRGQGRDAAARAAPSANISVAGLVAVAERGRSRGPSQVEARNRFHHLSSSPPCRLRGQIGETTAAERRLTPQAGHTTQRRVRPQGWACESLGRSPADAVDRVGDRRGLAHEAVRVPWSAVMDQPGAREEAVALLPLTREHATRLDGEGNMRTVPEAKLVQATVVIVQRPEHAQDHLLCRHRHAGDDLDQLLQTRGIHCEERRNAGKRL
mmetsp:Transcript_39657/g.102740  ORF Transcript_39657/g.102740 Transcript_39657/m.102740 type:complete len:253 (+) Transcript_39657:19-777(+)